MVIAGTLAFSAPAGATSAPAVPANVPVVAGARTPTTTTVTAVFPRVVSGKPVVFIAQVLPVRLGKIKLSGNVNWVIIGPKGGHLHCSVTSAITGAGKAKCRIAKGKLLSATTPATVTANYSGDSTFAPSSGHVTQLADQGVTRVRLVLPIRPTSGASTLVQAYVKDGPGTGIIVGNVVFTAQSGLSRPGVSLRCEGKTTPPGVVDSKPVLAGVATCRLRPGWIVNPPAVGPNSSKRSSWTITATYVGSLSFSGSTTTHTGHAQAPLP
jgi:hypothetical protein